MRYFGLYKIIIFIKNLNYNKFCKITNYNTGKRHINIQKQCYNMDPIKLTQL